MADVSKYSLQIVVTSSKHPDEIIGAGNGFVYRYRDKKFFITAAHVVPDIVSQGGEVYILTHLSNDRLSTQVIDIKDFYNLTYLQDIGKDLFCIEFNQHPVDCAFCDLSNKEVKTIPIIFNDDSINVDHHFRINSIPKEDTTEPNIADKYIVCGRIVQQIRGVVWEAKAYTYSNIDYEGPGVWGLLSFLFREVPDMKQWCGLSGSPFFNEHGKLIGMVQEKDPNTERVLVLSIKTIEESIDLMYFQDNVHYCEEDNV